MQKTWINFIGLEKELRDVKKAVVTAPRGSGKTTSIKLLAELLKARHDGDLCIQYFALTDLMTKFFKDANPHIFAEGGSKCALFLDEGLFFARDKLNAMLAEAAALPCEYIYIFSSFPTDDDEFESLKGFIYIDAPLGVTPNEQSFTHLS